AEPVTAPPFALAGIGASPQLVAAASARLSAAAAAAVAAIPRRQGWRRHDGRVLRIGYLSPDFRAHSAGFSIAPLIAAHARDGFEWLGYGLARAEAEFRNRFDRYVDLSGVDDRGAAARIHADGIDVLIDLAGHTKGSRLEILALTPAPVQAHYL